MVDQTQRLSRYRELIQELNETKKMEIARRTVELFFSFDIVNSSLYKTINVSAKYCYVTHELRLHQNDRCKRFTLF